MQKLTLLLLLTGFFGHAQIDYKALVRDLEDVTLTTDIKTYFNEVPIEDKNGKISCKDERFLRFYGTQVNTVTFKETAEGDRIMEITPFLEKEDYAQITASLTKIHGTPKTDHVADAKNLIWVTDEKEVHLKDMLNAGRYAKLSVLKITFFKY